MALSPLILGRVGVSQKYANQAALDAATGSAGEPAINSTNRLVTFDGTNAGGYTHALLQDLMGPGRPVLSCAGAGIDFSDVDVAAATALRIIPRLSNWLPILATVAGVADVPMMRQYAETVFNLDSNAGHTNYHQSGKNYDMWAYWNGTTVVFATSPSWTAGAVAGGDNARGTGAGSTDWNWVNGVPTNTNAFTALRFGTNAGDTVAVAAKRATLIGSFRCSADGQVDDTFAKRWVGNLWLPRHRPLKRIDPAATWVYSNATAFQQANANALNEISALMCVPGRTGVSRVIGQGFNSTATARTIRVGIGINSTTVDSSNLITAVGVGTTPAYVEANFQGVLPLGLARMVWLELGAGADIQTWLGLQSASIPIWRNGISGWADV